MSSMGAFKNICPSSMHCSLDLTNISGRGSRFGTWNAKIRIERTPGSFTPQSPPKLDISMML
jgi:hypothetical protein